MHESEECRILQMSGRKRDSLKTSQNDAVHDENQPVDVIHQHFGRMLEKKTKGYFVVIQHRWKGLSSDQCPYFDRGCILEYVGIALQQFPHRRII
jgi:hypothetical protein